MLVEKKTFSKHIQIIHLKNLKTKLLNWKKTKTNDENQESKQTSKNNTHTTLEQEQQQQQQTKASENLTKPNRISLLVLEV